jgi:TonB family protein
MAEVWLARNVHLGTPAAIKFLNRAYAGVNEVEQRFINEGRRQGLLSHPNIIKVYGFEYVDDHGFLILQYVDGESLEDLLQRVGRLETVEALRIGISLLNGLDHAHTAQIVHRDIKPSNILVDKQGFPYLGDFGIVLAVDEQRMTRTGTSMGTALYMSPEQITKPGSVDRRSDIYSFGCVLYEMLSGEPPFNVESTGDGSTDFLIKTAHVQQAPPPLRSRNASVSSAIESVVMRCLAKNPADRYATCHDLREALSAAMVARPSASLLRGPEPIQPPRREATVIEPPRARLDAHPPRGQRARISVMIALALVAIAGGLWIVAARKPASESSKPASSQVSQRPPVEQPPPVKESPPGDKPPTEPGHRAPESSKPASSQVPRRPPVEQMPPVKESPLGEKPPTEAPTAYKIGGGVSAPVRIFGQEPVYCEEARAAKLQGDVVLFLVVDESGSPRDIKVIRGLGMGLDQKAIEAVQKWKFRPGMKDGHPVAVQAHINVSFRLI